MEWLNFHHLLYFRAIAREGSIAGASRALRLSRSTVSTQLKQFERSLERPLFRKRHGRLVLTPFGEEVSRYADEIDALGRSVVRLARGEVALRPLTVGVVPGLPASMVSGVLAGATENLRVRCRTADFATLVQWLRDDVADVAFTVERPPADSGLRTRKILESEVALFAAPVLAKKLSPRFPELLHDAPFVLPDPSSALGISVRHWLEQRRIAVREVAVVDDLELLRQLAATGLGVFAVRTAFSGDVERRYGVQRVGALSGLVERCYLLSPRDEDAPFVRSLVESARRVSLAGTSAAG